MGELRSGSVSLAEIIAYIKQTNQTGSLSIRQENEAGPPAALTFEAGHLIDARRGQEIGGDDLVYRLLSTRGGIYSFDHSNVLPAGAERNIARWQELLILATIGVIGEEGTAPAGPKGHPDTLLDERPATPAPPVPAPPAPASPPPPAAPAPRSSFTTTRLDLPPAGPAPAAPARSSFTTARLDLPPGPVGTPPGPAPPRPPAEPPAGAAGPPPSVNAFATSVLPDRLPGPGAYAVGTPPPADPRAGVAPNTPPGAGGAQPPYPGPAYPAPVAGATPGGAPDGRGAGPLPPAPVGTTQESPLPPLPPPALPPESGPLSPALLRFRVPVPLPPTPPLPTGLDQPEADFMALLERLESDHFSGYLAWASEAADGRLFFYLGEVIEALWYELVSSVIYTEKRAMRRFTTAARDTAAARQHLACHPLEPNFVWSYSSLAGGLDRPQDRNLTGVQWPVLIERAAFRRLTGCVQVTAGGETAYLFLCQGASVGEYAPGPVGLIAAPDRPAALCARPDSRVDVYTARERHDLESLNHIAWSVEQVAAALSKAALAVLGPRGQQVVKLFSGAGSDVQALRAACTRAKQVTRLFIGTEEYEQLSRRMDHLLAHLRT